MGCCARVLGTRGVPQDGSCALLAWLNASLSQDCLGKQEGENKEPHTHGTTNYKSIAPVGLLFGAHVFGVLRDVMKQRSRPHRIVLPPVLASQ